MPLLGRKEMATHSSILAWEIPWPEEPDGLQFMGCKGVRQDLVPEHAGSYPKSFGDQEIKILRMILQQETGHFNWSWRSSNLFQYLLFLSQNFKFQRQHALKDQFLSCIHALAKRGEASNYSPPQSRVLNLQDLMPDCEASRSNAMAGSLDQEQDFLLLGGKIIRPPGYNQSA